MNISMDKKYTLDGKPFTVLTVTKPGAFSVVGYTADGSLYRFTCDGNVKYSTTGLVEVSPYADFVIDEKVMVRNSDSENWTRRLFSGMDKNTGLALASRYTKWIREATGCSPGWNQCRRPTAEELSE